MPGLLFLGCLDRVLSEGPRLGMFRQVVPSGLPGSVRGIPEFEVWLWSLKEPFVGHFLR